VADGHVLGQRVPGEPDGKVALLTALRTPLERHAVMAPHCHAVFQDQLRLGGTLTTTERRGEVGSDELAVADREEGGPVAANPSLGGLHKETTASHVERGTVGGNEGVPSWQPLAA